MEKADRSVRNERYAREDNGGEINERERDNSQQKACIIQCRNEEACFGEGLVLG